MLSHRNAPVFDDVAATIRLRSGAAGLSTGAESLQFDPAPRRELAPPRTVDPARHGGR